MKRSSRSHWETSLSQEERDENPPAEEEPGMSKGRVERTPEDALQKSDAKLRQREKPENKIRT